MTPHSVTALEAETPRAMHGADGGPSRAGQYVTFLCAAVEYAIPILQLQEIKGWGPVTPIPCAPRLLLGVMNLRGAVVPVVDLRRALGLGDCAFEAQTAVLLVQSDTHSASRTIGIVVDSVCGVSSIEPRAIRPVPNVGIRSDDLALAGIAAFDDRMVLLIDGAPLIDAVSKLARPGAGPCPKARLTAVSAVGPDLAGLIA